MPLGERETLQRRPKSELGVTQYDPFEEAEHLTPTPGSITAEAAWEHANHVHRRNTDMISAIAHASGVGMDVADRIRSVEEKADHTSKKLKKWQAVAIAALTAAGSGLVAAGKMLYEKGGAEATMSARIQYLEAEVQRIRDRVERRRWEQPDTKE